MRRGYEASSSQFVAARGPRFSLPGTGDLLRPMGAAALNPAPLRWAAIRRSSTDLRAAYGTV